MAACSLLPRPGKAGFIPRMVTYEITHDGSNDCMGTTTRIVKAKNKKKARLIPFWGGTTADGMSYGIGPIVDIRRIRPQKYSKKI